MYVVAGKNNFRDADQKLLPFHSVHRLYFSVIPPLFRQEDQNLYT